MREAQQGFAARVSEVAAAGGPVGAVPDGKQPDAEAEPGADLAAVASFVVPADGTQNDTPVQHVQADG